MTNEQDKMRIVQVASLRSIELFKSSIEVIEDIQSETGSVDINVGMEAKIKREPDGDAAGFFIAYCNVTLMGKDEQSEQKLFDASAIFKVLYALREIHDWDEEEVDFFVSRNVIIHAWPYIREHFDSLSRKTCLNPVVVPLIPIRNISRTVDADAVKE